MIRAGANRIGASAGVAIVKEELATKVNQQPLNGPQGSS